MFQKAETQWQQKKGVRGQLVFYEPKDTESHQICGTRVHDSKKGRNKTRNNSFCLIFFRCYFFSPYSYCPYFWMQPRLLFPVLLSGGGCWETLLFQTVSRMAVGHKLIFVRELFSDE